MPFTILAAEGGEIEPNIDVLEGRYTLGTNTSTYMGATSDPTIVRVPGTTCFQSLTGSASQSSGIIAGRLQDSGAPTSLQTAFANYRTISLAYAGRGNGGSVSTAGCMMGFINSISATTDVKLNFGVYITANTIIIRSSSVSFTVDKSSFPSVAADAWGQVEVIFIADALGSPSGVVKIFYQDTLVAESSYTIANTAFTSTINYLALRAFNVGSTAASPRRMHFEYEDDYVIAFGTDPNERLGATYISAIAPTADVSTTNWTSSDSTTPLADVVNKNTYVTATPFIQTDSIGDEAIFSSSTSMPNDGRVVRAVQVRGAGQSNSDIATAQFVVNGTLIDQPYNLAIGAQTVLNENSSGLLPAPGNWLNTDPADSQPWDVTKINNLEFGVRRIT